MYVKSEEEGNSLGRNLFGNSIAPSIGPIPPSPSVTAPAAIDDWGFPVKVSPEVAASVNASFGIKPGPPAFNPVPTADVKAREEKERKAKHAKSLMEMVGVGYAAGTVAVSKKWVASTGRDVQGYKVNPRQVNDLADATRDTFIEWFGDRDLKPWHMMMLLTMGIPMSMWLQAPKVEKKEEDSSDKPSLKSVR